MDNGPTSGPRGLGKIAAYFDSIGKIVAALAGVIALITGVSLVYLVRPDPPAETNASLTDLRFVGRMTLEDYLRRTGRDPGGYSPDERKQVGNYYLVTVTTEGLRRRSVGIFWSVLSPEGVPIPSPEQWIRQLLTKLTPLSDKYKETARLWIQNPPVEGTFYAEITIDYPDKSSLDVATTPPFPGMASQPRAIRPVTVEKTVTTVMTVPETTTQIVTTVEETTTTGTTLVPTTIETTVPATTTTVTTTTMETVRSPVPLPRPRVPLTPVSP